MTKLLQNNIQAMKKVNEKNSQITLKLTTTEVELKESGQQIDSLKEHVDKVENQLVRLQEAHKKTTQDMELSSSELVTNKQKEIDTLQTDLTTAVEEAHKLQKVIIRNTEDIQIKAKEIEDLIKENKTINETVDRVKSHVQ